MLTLALIVAILVLFTFLAVAAGTLATDYLAVAFIFLAVLAVAVGKKIAHYHLGPQRGSHRLHKRGKIHVTE